MYESFFGFKEKPFDIAPDPRFFYSGKTHGEALANLIYGIRERKGFVVLIGEEGTGKTTLIRVLLEQLDQDVQVAYVLNPKLSFTSFLKFTLHELGLQVKARSKVDLLMKLQDFLLQSRQDNKTTVLVVDGAQYLNASFLEEIRMLTNLETSKGKLLQVLLVGSPEVSDLLDRPELSQLRQRINIRHHLLPLDCDEMREYIKTRLKAARGELHSCFTEGAIKRIHKHSRGVPGLINSTCDNALLLGYRLSKPMINVEIVEKSVTGIEADRFQKSYQPERKMVEDITKRPYSVSMRYMALLIVLPAVGIALLLLSKPDRFFAPFKPFDTMQSLLQKRQTPVAKDVETLAKREGIKDGELKPLVTVEAEIIPDSGVAKVSPDTVFKEESTEELSADAVPQSPSGLGISATSHWMVREESGVGEMIARDSEKADAQFSKEVGGQYAEIDGASQIDMGQAIQLQQGLEYPDSDLPEETQKVEKDVRLDVKDSGEEHLSSLTQTMKFDSLGETEGLDKRLEVRKPSEELSGAVSMESEGTEIKEHQGTVTSERVLLEMIALERLLEKDAGAERFGEAPTQKVLKKDKAFKEVLRHSSVAQEVLSKRELADVSTDNLTEVETKTAKGLSERSRGYSRDSVGDKRTRERGDQVNVGEEEVKEFLTEYIDRYNRNDISGFLSLFSPRAIQNANDDFKEIEKIYSRFFDQSQELRFHVENARIEIYRNISIAGEFFESAAQAEAQYQIDQVLKKGGENKVFRGHIRWILTREDEALRIRYLDYRQEKYQDSGEKGSPKQKARAFGLEENR